MLKKIFRIALILTVVVAPIVSTLFTNVEPAYGASWLADYLYRKEIIISNSTGGDLTNYPVEMTVNKPASFVYFNGNNHTTGTYQIGMATTDSFTAYSGFTKYASNPVLSPGGAGAWDEGGVKDPCVITIGRKYIMYYGGYTPAGVFCIGIAESYDGYLWTKYASNPVLSPTPASWDSDDVEFPRVYDTGVAGAKRYRMHYSGFNGTTFQIGYAYSADGYTWSKGASNPVVPVGTAGQWDSYWTLSTTNVVNVSGTYYFLYGGESSGSSWNIGLCSFTDWEGTYTKYAGNPIIEHKTSASQLLTSSLGAGTSTVYVTDTSGFAEGEPVFVHTAGLTEFVRIDEIVNTTTMTLTTTVANTYGVGSTIRSWMYKSVTPSTLIYDAVSGTWTCEFTAFQSLSEFSIGLQEISALAGSSNLYDWNVYYNESPPIPFEYYDGGWDDVSAENPIIVNTDFNNNCFTGATTQDDFDDVRFTTDDGTTLLDQFRATYTSAVSANYWVEIPSIPAGDSTTIYMYYGNASATLSSDATTVFTFADEFSGGSLDGAKWDNLNSATVSVGGGICQVTSSATAWRAIASKSALTQGQVMLVYSKMGSTDGDNNFVGFAPDQTPAVNRVGYFWGFSGGFNYLTSGATSTYTNVNYGYANENYHFYRIKWTSGHSVFRVDNYQNTAMDLTTNVPTANLKITANVYTITNSFVYLDWVAVYTPASTEPTMVWSALESSFATVVANTATAVGGSSATLNGNITAIGESSPDLRGFDWGLTTAYEVGSWQESGTFTTGTFSHDITGLSTGTVYHVRAKAHNASGWSYSYDVSFTTSTTSAPTLLTNNAVNISQTGATLQGTLSSLGDYSTVYVYFEYGTSLLYGTSTAEQTYTTVSSYSAIITGLTSGTTYHYRAVVRYNTSDYVYGSDITFVTTSSSGIPTPPTNFLVSSFTDTSVTLTWTRGSGTNTYINYSTSNYPASPSEGTNIYSSTGVTTVATTLTTGVRYYFSAWSVTGGTYSATYVTVTCVPSLDVLPPPDIFNIESVQVYQSYINNGDQLVVLSTHIEWVSGTPVAYNPDDFFYIQILDGSTIVKQDRLRLWGYVPASLYVSELVPLTWNKTYTIKIIGTNKFTTPHEATYTLTTSNYIGDDYSRLSTWVVELATRMQNYSYWAGVELLDYSNLAQVILTGRGRQIFTMAIPNIDDKCTDIFYPAIKGYAPDELESGELAYVEQLKSLEETNSGTLLWGLYTALGDYVDLEPEQVSKFLWVFLWLVGTIVLCIVGIPFYIAIPVTSPVMLGLTQIGAVDFGVIIGFVVIISAVLVWKLVLENAN